MFTMRFIVYERDNDTLEICFQAQNAIECFKTKEQSFHR